MLQFIVYVDYDVYRWKLVDSRFPNHPVAESRSYSDKAEILAAIKLVKEKALHATIVDRTPATLPKQSPPTIRFGPGDTFS